MLRSETATLHDARHTTLCLMIRDTDFLCVQIIKHYTNVVFTYLLLTDAHVNHTFSHQLHGWSSSFWSENISVSSSGINVSMTAGHIPCRFSQAWHTSSRNHTLIFWVDSLFTPSVVLAVMLVTSGHFKNHWTELNWQPNVSHEILTCAQMLAASQPAYHMDQKTVIRKTYIVQA